MKYYCLNIYIKNYENNSNNIIYYCCPTPGCNKNIPCKNKNSKLECPSCKKAYCLKCYRPWHHNIKCEDYYIQNTIYNDEEFKDQIYQIEAKDKININNVQDVIHLC